MTRAETGTAIVTIALAGAMVLLAVSQPQVLLLATHHPVAAKKAALLLPMLTLITMLTLVTTAIVRRDSRRNQ